QEEEQFNAEMGIFITGQEQVQRLHREYMNDNTPTDVLSFAMREKVEGSPEFPFPSEEAEHLGEVIISYPQAEIQATEHGHSVRHEVLVLLIHGALHLLGYDHDEPLRTQNMQAREQTILKLVEDMAH
ncbi:MAG: rRNA maturation RNase YbeY, partial [Dehalococcoidia bacterium]|nr:rRNA maturation RNase YbeY [Dehalococcoidia bacterium]